MAPVRVTGEQIIDYITGEKLINTGAEANRQQVECLLIKEKGFKKQEVKVNVPIRLVMEDGTYESMLDLVVVVKDCFYMVIKCAPGSLSSREREVISAARLLTTYQIPLSVASDGQTAIVWDTASTKIIGQGLEAIPSRALAEKTFNPSLLIPLQPAKRRGQQLIFRSYDMMNVNMGLRRLSKS